MENLHKNPPCHICKAKCCQYFALEIDKPTTLYEFENLKWYLLHEKTMIFVDNKEWFLQINNPCTHLSSDYQCLIYKKRPIICQEYGFDNENRISCDNIGKEDDHDTVFKTLKDLENYIRKRFPRSKRYDSKKKNSRS